MHPVNKHYDRLLKTELLNARKRTMEEAERYYSDVWLLGKNVTKLYPCFTKDWLSRYGCYLVRIRVEIWDEEENCRTTSWGYSLNYIKKRIAEGYVSCYPHRYYFNEDNTKFRMTHEYYW